MLTPLSSLSDTDSALHHTCWCCRATSEGLLPIRPRRYAFAFCPTATLRLRQKADTVPDKRPSAILLLGPTASGKTPLGRLLESRGLSGSSCRHFDFGENLRRIVRTGQPDGIVSDADITYLRDVLQRGALLEDDDFPIAKRIIESFLARGDQDERALVVLNGLPRHQGQARDLAELLDVQAVVYLRCSAETVFERVQLDTGGDRRYRTDDDSEAIREKLAIFERSTKPLIDYYRQAGSHLVTLQVTNSTTPEQMWETLQSAVRAGT